MEQSGVEYVAGEEETEGIAQKNPKLAAMIEYETMFGNIEINQEVKVFLSEYCFEEEGSEEITQEILELLKNGADVQWMELLYENRKKSGFQEITDEILCIYKENIPFSVCSNWVKECKAAFELMLNRKSYVPVKEELLEGAETIFQQSEAEQSEREAEQLERIEADTAAPKTEYTETHMVKPPVKSMNSYSDALEQYFNMVLDSEEDEREHFADKLLIYVSKAVEEQRRSDEAIKKYKDLINIQKSMLKKADGTIAEYKIQEKQLKAEVVRLTEEVKDKSRKLHSLILKFKEINLLQSSFSEPALIENKEDD